MQAKYYIYTKTDYGWHKGAGFDSLIEAKNNVDELRKLFHGTLEARITYKRHTLAQWGEQE